MIFQVESPVGPHFVEAPDVVTAELVAYRQAQYSHELAQKLEPWRFRVYHQLCGDHQEFQRNLRQRIARDRRQA